MADRRGLTPLEFAKAQGISVQRVRTLIRQGRIKVVRHEEPMLWYEIPLGTKLPVMQGLGWPRGVLRPTRRARLATALRRTKVAR